MSVPALINCMQPFFRFFFLSISGPLHDVKNFPQVQAFLVTWYMTTVDLSMEVYKEEAKK